MSNKILFHFETMIYNSHLKMIKKKILNDDIDVQDFKDLTIFTIDDKFKVNLQQLRHLKKNQ